MAFEYYLKKHNFHEQMTANKCLLSSTYKVDRSTVHSGSEFYLRQKYMFVNTFTSLALVKCFWLGHLPELYAMKPLPAAIFRSRRRMKWRRQYRIGSSYIATYSCVKETPRDAKFSLGLANISIFNTGYALFF
jgi:hypothetical protein